MSTVFLGYSKQLNGSAVVQTYSQTGVRGEFCSCFGSSVGPAFRYHGTAGGDHKYRSRRVDSDPVCVRTEFGAGLVPHTSIFAVFQCTGVFIALEKGFGKSIDEINPGNLVPIQKATYTSDILYIITLFFSKLSTAFLFLRLTPGRGHSIAIWSTISACVVWAFVSVLLVAIRCHPQHPWVDTTTAVCSNLFARWQFIAALDILTEVALFSISLYLIWGIQMSMKSKTIVVTAFSCRLPVIALAGLRLFYLHHQLNSSNPTLEGGPPAVSVTQIEIGYSILASIVPCLKNFMAAYDAPVQSGNWYQHYTNNTRYTHELTSVASKSVNSRSEKGARSDVNESVDREDPVAKKSCAPKVLAGGLGKLRPEQISYEARVTHREPEVEREEGETRSVDSGNSRRMIIKKGVEWSVDYDARTAESGADEEK